MRKQAFQQIFSGTNIYCVSTHSLLLRFTKSFHLVIVLNINSPCLGVRGDSYPPSNLTALDQAYTSKEEAYVTIKGPRFCDLESCRAWLEFPRSFQRKEVEA